MILIVDDDNAVRVSLKLILERNGYKVAVAENPAKAIELARGEEPRLAIIDMNFKRLTTGQEGIELLQRLKVLHPDMPVILMTAWGSIPLAVEGIQRGAFDFITKPWDNAALLQRIATALELNKRIPASDQGEFDRSAIIGQNAGLLNVLDTVKRIACTDASVLIMGENGTGKELIAEAIHKNSLRARAPFVKTNLGGIPQSLFESEMFGHKRGAFTGAVADREGRFAMADGGTIFLDEIGELDLNSQVKLLRVLQEHTYEMLGDSAPRRTDVRVVCATNANLPQMVIDKTFREDLYYRINLITITLPPLRERSDDIPALVDFLAKKACAANGLEVPEITPEAICYLQSLPYPGNIRELKNIVERTILINRAPKLEKKHFAAAYSSMPQANAQAKDVSDLDGMQREMIERTLAQCQGNVSRAAAMLGISRQALYRKLEKYGISL